MQRDDKPALIALALLLFTILSLALIETSSRYAATNPPAQERSAGMNQQERENEPPGEVASQSYQFFGDSAAQWTMALFTVLATVISAIAVKLVNDTLQTSRKATEAAVEAVTVTRDIGERQLRPYIVYEDGKVSTLPIGTGHPTQLEITARFRNCGASPGIVTAKSGALYAPGDSPGWESKGGSWQALRAVVGPNQTIRLKFDAINADQEGNFTWFTIGILIWYESVAGSKYEDHFWLTFDGTSLRQDFPESGRALYRPEHEDSNDKRQ